MTVRIVTDSTSDLPAELARELEITVVPLNVHFGLDTFQDGVDMNADQFYHRLLTSPILPKTSAPSPGLFKRNYEDLARNGHDVVSIHISSKLSGTYEAALAGKQALNNGSRVEVFDSMSATMGVGLLAIAAAKAARSGAGLNEVVDLVRQSIDKVHMVCALDTLDFLQKGGRVGKAQAWLGSLLNIKPIISMAEGEVVPLERVRTYGKAVDRARQLLQTHIPARELAIVYSTDPQEGKRMIDYAKSVSPQQRVCLARLGPVLGTYVGPNSLAFIALE
jgi:DegV family protein with EDD domain